MPATVPVEPNKLKPMISGQSQEHRKLHIVALLIMAVLPWVWLGIVVGISLIETPIRFRTPPITRAGAAMLGVAIFHALAYLELVLLVVMIAALAIVRHRLLGVLIGILGVTVAAEHAIVVPLLGIRAAQLVEGLALEPSSVHSWATVLEGMKMVLLSVVGIRSLGLLLQR